jgi:hypothetical protein
MLKITKLFAAEGLFSTDDSLASTTSGIEEGRLPVKNVLSPVERTCPDR